MGRQINNSIPSVFEMNTSDIHTFSRVQMIFESFFYFQFLILSISYGLQILKRCCFNELIISGGGLIVPSLKRMRNIFFLRHFNEIFQK